MFDLTKGRFGNLWFSLNDWKLAWKQICNHPIKNSKELFEAFRALNVSKMSQCCILKHLAMSTKPIVCLPLKSNHLIKSNQKVLFTVELVKMVVPEGDGSVKSRVVIISNEVVGYWKVNIGVKMTNSGNIKLLKAYLLWRLKKKTMAYEWTGVWIHENSSTHVINITAE